MEIFHSKLREGKKVLKTQEEDIFDLSKLGSERPQPKIRQPETAQERYYMTMQGFLVEYMMRHGPATLDNLILAVSKIIKNLRKASGGKYKENLAKSVKGLLYSKPVFQSDGNMWHVNERQASKAEERIVSQISRRMQHLNKQEDKQGDKVTRFLRMLERFSQNLFQDNLLRPIVQKPFKELRKNDTILDAIKKVGSERYLGCVQIF